MNKRSGFASGPPVRSFLLLAVVIAVPAFAQTVYSWEDADGVHYTDDPAQVPKEKKATGTVFEPRPVPKNTTLAVAPVPSTVPAPETATTEYQWRDSFIAANRRITTLREKIAALYASLPPRTECVPQPVVANVNGQVLRPVARCQVNALYDQLQVEIGQNKVELAAAEADLDQLDRRASMVGVPREWRRGW